MSNNNNVNMDKLFEAFKQFCEQNPEAINDLLNNSNNKVSHKKKANVNYDSFEPTNDLIDLDVVEKSSILIPECTFKICSFSKYDSEQKIKEIASNARKEINACIKKFSKDAMIKHYKGKISFYNMNFIQDEDMVVLYFNLGSKQDQMAYVTPWKYR